MLLFGLGDGSKTIMLFLILVFQVVIAVRDSIRAIPEEVFYPLASLGAPFRVILWEVLLPASLPKFMTAVRVAMATAISVLFFTETFGTQYGMGYFIMDAWLRVNYLEMYSGIVVLSAMGLFLFGVLDFAERYFCRWQGRE
jgi:NitT/TauT family transport system permease protein